MDHGAVENDVRFQKSSRLSFEQTKLRRTILASYWTVVLLALPLWWYTTSIERLSLPVSRVNSQRDKELRFPLRVELDTSAVALDTAVLVKDVETALDAVTRRAPESFGNLDLHITVAQKDVLSPDAYGVSVIQGIEEPLIQGRSLSVPIQEVSHIPQLLSSLLSPYSSHTGFGGLEHLVAKYAPRYRLAFTVLNEDAAGGQAVVGWDVQSSISRHLSFFLDRISVLHNFTIESQLRFHAPLAFEPKIVGSDGEEVHGLTQDDLKIFVNSAEWTLSSSVSNDPVLHFILFIPSASHAPLRILDADDKPTSSDAFILPQWGGIVLMNLPQNAPSRIHLSTPELDHTFSLFRAQLLTLLGVPNLPAIVALTDPSSPLTDWQLDALHRRRTIENTISSKETLESIVQLVDEIPNMPVGPDVRDDIQDALTALDKVYASASSSPMLALQYSSQASTLASRAFFNPGMLALLYFPAEHKYAVYTPLFAPVAVPLLVTLFREWKKARAGADEDKDENTVGERSTRTDQKD
ncbi:hypothetical protein EW146_g339 [Bondarzewia mesenterica]|uniref:GPI transamidase component PIG-S n=1 Tax=Bondarzewia mesenterica TaxID=1095465 RepID=A0A4S4M795_9AGAM|nr:hypothetical protein EW146_g339 [Bondarzewia mesenterica]